MTAEPRRRGSEVRTAKGEFPLLPLGVAVQLNDLLMAAASVTQEANATWAEIWGQCKDLATGGGMVLSGSKEGFVPPCGWPEFLEHLWLLKHYLDSLQRICQKEH